MKKVVVVGNSCAGKTTFSRRLAQALGAKHIELDALFWEPNWQQADPEVFRARVAQCLEGASWVSDGNYESKIKDVVWPQADTLIWLDPPLRTILMRFILRSFSRSFRQELLWNGCRENLRNSIFSKDSLLLWILSTHKKKAETYSQLLQNPPDNLRVIRLRTNQEVESFLPG